MTTALLSLGSNMGDSLALLREAVRGLGPAVRRVSSVYRTPPWGPVAQDDFLNIAVLVADPDRDARGWLDLCHVVERAAHRERLVHWGPRTLDADVVAVWEGTVEESVVGSEDGAGAIALGAPIVSADPVLTLPHPRAHERGFVLVPWAEIDPDATLPGYGPVATRVAALDVSDIVKVTDADWLGVPEDEPEGAGARGAAGPSGVAR